MKKKLISPLEQDFIKLAINIENTGKPPSSRQVKKILGIKEKIECEGFEYNKDDW